MVEEPWQTQGPRKVLFGPVHRALITLRRPLESENPYGKWSIQLVSMSQSWNYG